MSTSPTAARNSTPEVLTTEDLAAEFGIKPQSISYHLSRIFPDNKGKYYRLVGEDQARARNYLRRVTQKGNQGGFSQALIADLVALAALHGVSIKATGGKAGVNRHLLVQATSPEQMPRVQIVTQSVANVELG